MSLPTAGKKATSVFDAPPGDVAGVSVIIDMETELGSNTDFTGDINTTDANRSRWALDDSDTEIAFDWWADDVTSDLEEARAYVGTVLAASTDAARTIAIYTPNTRNTAYSASDVYGQYNAYDDDWLGYWPLTSDADDRTSTQNNGVDQGSISYGGAAGQLGVATQYTSGAWTQLSPIFDGLKNNYEIFLTASGTSAGTFFGQCTSLSSSPRFIVRANNTSDYSAFSGSSFPSWSTSDHLDGDFHMLGFGSDGDSGTRGLSIDGVLGGSTNNTPFGDGTYDNAGIAGVNRGGSSYNPISSTIQHVSAHDSFRGSNWRPYEYSQISDNPTFWGTWTVSDVSGGTTYNVTCTDSLSVSDLSTAAAIISGALSDGISLSDLSTKALFLNLTASDGLSLTDLSGPALSLNLSADELITFSDAVTAITNINATLSDLISFLDSAAASSFAPINVTCSDGLLLADTAQGAITLDLSALDGLELTDASNGAITFNVNCPDGIELSDFAQAACIILGSCVDGLTLTDIAQETSFLPQGMVRIVGTGKAYKVIFDIVKRPKITGGN